MSKNGKFDSTDLSSRLFSNLCHELISPISSILTGLELLSEEKDTDTKEQYLKMINSSAVTTSDKLRFMQVAFGITPVVDSKCDLNEIQNIATRYLSEEKFELNWSVPDISIPIIYVKMLLNLLLLSVRCNSPNGNISVNMSGTSEIPQFKVISTSSKPKIPADITELFQKGTSEFDNPIQILPYHCKLYAEEINVDVKIEEIDNSVSISMSSS